MIEEALVVARRQHAYFEKQTGSINQKIAQDCLDEISRLLLEAERNGSTQGDSDEKSPMRE